MPYAFQPLGNTRTSFGPLSATAVSIPPLGRNIRVANLGPSDALVALTQTFTPSTANAFVVMARTVEIFDRTLNTVLVAQGQLGSAVLDITSGEGQ